MENHLLCHILPYVGYAAHRPGVLECRRVYRQGQAQEGGH